MNLYDFSNVRLYIDPATTSYVVQIIAGIIIACGAGLGIFWNKLKRFFRRKKEEKYNVSDMSEMIVSKENKDIIKAEDLLNEDMEDIK